jgi:hypothetical protein
MQRNNCSRRFDKYAKIIMFDTFLIFLRDMGGH